MATEDQRYDPLLLLNVDGIPTKTDHTIDYHSSLLNNGYFVYRKRWPFLASVALVIFTANATLMGLVPVSAMAAVFYETEAHVINLTNGIIFIVAPPVYGALMLLHKKCDTR